MKQQLGAKLHQILSFLNKKQIVIGVPKKFDRF